MKINHKILSLAAVLLSGLAFVPDVWAMSAQEAKAAGLIKEDCRGYVTATSAQGQSIADDINGKRATEYKKIAAADGKITVEMVAAAAGQKLCGR